MSYISKSGFQWFSEPIIRCRQGIENIIRERNGLTNHGKVTQIKQSFDLFFNKEIKEKIIKYTNQKATCVLQDSQTLIRWIGLEIDQFDAFLGLLLMAGILKSNLQTIDELWDYTDVGPPLFHAVMTKRRFETILRFIRFDDTDTRQERRQNHKFAAFKEIFTLFESTLRAPYKPPEFLTIDEQLSPYHGKCPFRQFMPSKPAKYGIKWWVLCDALNSCFKYLHLSWKTTI